MKNFSSDLNHPFGGLIIIYKTSISSKSYILIKYKNLTDAHNQNVQEKGQDYPIDEWSKKIKLKN